MCPILTKGSILHPHLNIFYIYSVARNVVKTL